MPRLPWRGRSEASLLLGWLGSWNALNNLDQAAGNRQRKKVRMTGTQLHHEEAFGRTGFDGANRL